MRDGNMDVINLIAHALEKRGWSSSMSSMFCLKIKGDSASSDKEIEAILMNDAKVSSFPDFIEDLTLSNHCYWITYKQHPLDDYLSKAQREEMNKQNYEEQDDDKIAPPKISD